MVTAVHLSLELPAPPHLSLLLLGNNNSSTQLGNHGVGLRHHGICHCARIPPLSGHALPVPLPKQPCILGQRPQVYAASTSSQMPTDIEASMHTMSLHTLDNQWYMDTDATSHTAASQGNLSSYFPVSNLNQKVIIGSGHGIPIHGTGHTLITISHQPLHLNHVLHAPTIIKNLIYVRRLTTDNNVSVSFDPFDFTVSDFQTGITLLRCDNRGDLYPVTTPPSFAGLTPSLWHSRLGHLGVSVLNSLRKNKFICCEPFNSYVVCDSCVLGKHVKLPFFDSQTTTLMHFDILHSDLWTSPILSSAGHKYYVLFLDDFTNFLWTFPISRKSHVFETFKSLTQLIQIQFLQKVKTFQCDNGGEYNNEFF